MRDIKFHMGMCKKDILIIIGIVNVVLVSWFLFGIAQNGLRRAYGQPQEQGEKADQASPPFGPGSSKISPFSTQLPADFPKDVPLYPGAQIISSVTDMNSPDKGRSVSLHTKDGMKKVIRFYEEDLNKQGWEITDRYKGSMGQMLTTAIVAGKDIRELSVNIIGTPSATLVTLAVK